MPQGIRAKNYEMQSMTEKMLFQIIRINERTCSLRLYWGEMEKDIQVSRKIRFLFPRCIS